MTEMQGELREDIRLAAGELVSVRDFLRFAVSNFTAAGLVYGHGTTSALDEAAFLILASLKLPIHEMEPWLDARLTTPERRHLADVIAQRIETRKPAPYIVGEAWIGPYSFRADERVIVPRSFIGELLLGGADDLFDVSGGVQSALDLCTGSGCLAILLAQVFPDAEIVGADVSDDALAVARENVGDYGLEEQVSLVQSDLFAGLKGQQFDLIVSNPPYVRTETVVNFPPEYAAEPALAHDGGEDGLELVRLILRGAAAHLATGGVIVVEVGQERELIEAEYPDTAFQWLDTELSAGEVFMLRKEDLPG